MKRLALLLSHVRCSAARGADGGDRRCDGLSGKQRPDRERNDPHSRRKDRRGRRERGCAERCAAHRRGRKDRDARVHRCFHATRASSRSVARSNTRDASARGTNNIAASFRVWDGLNSESVMWAPTRNEGVTSVVVAPMGGLVGGQAAVVDLVDGDAQRMLRRGPAAMVAQIESPPEGGTESHGELIGKLRDFLDDVKFYEAHRADYNRAAARPMSASRADMEAMIPVIHGALPLAIVADRVDDIESAIRLAHDYNLRIMIVGGAEAWLAASDLAVGAHPGHNRCDEQHPDQLPDAQPASGECGNPRQGGRPCRYHRQQRRRRRGVVQRPQREVRSGERRVVRHVTRRRAARGDAHSSGALRCRRPDRLAAARAAMRTSWYGVATRSSSPRASSTCSFTAPR